MDLSPEIKVDLELTSQDIGLELIEDLKKVKYIVNSGTSKTEIEVLQRKIKHILGEAYYFSWKDYKVVLKEQDKNAIDIIFDCTEDWKEEYGGSLIYKDEKGRYIKFMGLPNTMIIIERKNTEKYIQYVNNLSKGKKRYLLIGKIS